LRQAYDYWQDQPGNFVVSTTLPEGGQTQHDETGMSRRA
jgi:hypothetical protein